MNSIQDIVKSNLCLGCGFCTIAGNYKMVYSASKGQYIPHKIGLYSANEIDICPGNGYSINEMSEKLFAKDGVYSINLGYVHTSFVATTLSNTVLSNASSGGIMTQILLYLLEKGIVENVVVTKFIYTDQGPRTSTFFTNNIAEILDAQGSKYCPVNMESFVEDLDKFKDKKFVFVGTPCQIAAFRKIQSQDSIVNENLVLTLSNFCGGFKSYKNIQKIAKRHVIDYEKMKYFRFRGGGQPGSLLMIDSKNKSYTADYPSYSGHTGYSKLLRCHLCVDATAELADIACGDAWLDKYLQDSRPWSIILCRNKYSTELIKAMENDNFIMTNSLTHDDICYSQRQNLKSKKYRYKSRNKFYALLGYKLPYFDGGFHGEKTSLKTEFIVYSTHKIKEFSEKIGLFKILRTLAKKEY